MRTRLALISALTVLATVTCAHAAGKHSRSAKSTKSETRFVNPLSVSPATIKAGGVLHIKGTTFGAHKMVEILVYCPSWTSKRNPPAALSARTDGAGHFSTVWKVVAPKNGGKCRVYALNVGGKTNAWDTVGFTVKT